MLSHNFFRLWSSIFRCFFPRNICKSSYCVPFGTKFDNIKVICCPTFAQITSGEASSSHSIIWLPPSLYLLLFSKKVWNRYKFNYVDKVDTSFQFIGRSFSNVGRKIASFPVSFCNGSLSSHIITLSWFPELFSTCHSVKVSCKLSSFLYFEKFCVFICSGLALNSWIYSIFEQPSLEQFNLSNS